jgi:hypothetical protein
MPDGTKQEPGGWNRFAVEASDLASTVETLRKAGIRFRNEIVTGVGGNRLSLKTRQAILSNCSSQSPHRLASTRTARDNTAPGKMEAAASPCACPGVRTTVLPMSLGR